MRSILAMLSASLLTLLAFTPAVAAQDRLTPAARAAATERLAGTPAARPAAWNQLMGAGDISADPDTATTADLATRELMLQAGPATVFTAGDNQYPRGQLEDFTDPDGYAGSWGRVALKRKTCPAVGNHEYADPRRGPAGYLAYFSPPVLTDRTSSTREPAKAPSSPPCTPTVRRPDRVGGHTCWTASAPTPGRPGRAVRGTPTS